MKNLLGVIYKILGIWCNSSTSDFDSDDMGANPVIPVRLLDARQLKNILKIFKKVLTLKYWYDIIDLSIRQKHEKVKKRKQEGIKYAVQKH